MTDWSHSTGTVVQTMVGQVDNVVQQLFRLPLASCGLSKCQERRRFAAQYHGTVVGLRPQLVD